MASGSTTPIIRKTLRSKKPSLKALESQYLNQLLQTDLVENISSDEEFSNSDIEKPKLLHDKEIIHGKDIFKFHNRKTKDGLALKVAEACLQKTPHTIRHKTKSRIARIIQEDSGSEYEVSSEEDSEGSDEEISTDSDSDHDKNMKTKNNSEFKNIKLEPSKTRSTRKYTINTEEYFENCNINKVKTSNNTLDKLKTPRLPQYQLQSLLQNMKLSLEHEDAIQRLTKMNENCFNKWIFLLNENFNILLYGLGSKRNILKKFQNAYLNHHPVVVVNGFFPTLSIRSVLDSIITDLLELDESPANPVESCELLAKEFKKRSDHLYLIIHNIEGESLRNAKSQNILAKLASVSNIHLVASIDHINAPLIWDHNKLSKFNYIWWDVTSFLPYNEETSFERSMMVQQSGTLALSSLKNVFLSLTTNSKSIYTLIVKYQLDNTKNQYYQGFAFKDLYMACRESFIVSSDLALRAQLTEFVDHKMIKLKRAVDGTEYLLIPIPNDLLQKFLEEIS